MSQTLTIPILTSYYFCKTMKPFIWEAFVRFYLLSTRIKLQFICCIWHKLMSLRALSTQTPLQLDDCDWIRWAIRVRWWWHQVDVIFYHYIVFGTRKSLYWGSIRCFRLVFLYKHVPIIVVVSPKLAVSHINYLSILLLMDERWVKYNLWAHDSIR